MGYYLQAVVGDPQVWSRTFGSGDEALAERLCNHQDSYIRYLVGNGMDDGRDKSALRQAMQEYISGEVSGRVERDYLGTIAHAVMRDAGFPVQTSDVSFAEAMELADLLGDAAWLAETDWPIPIGPTEWNLVGVHSVETCRGILQRAESWDASSDPDPVEAVCEWARCAVERNLPLILFAS